jgi:hypothetical protein
MPGFLLNTSAKVLCMHAGQAQPIVPMPRVRVAGQPVTVQPNPYSIGGCSLPPNAGGPCVTAQWMTAATRVRAGGQPVLLQDSQATCAPTGTPVQVVFVQARVRGT